MFFLLFLWAFRAIYSDDTKSPKKGKTDMIKGVANVWVPVEDVERALDFYQNTLGFSLIKRDGPWAEVDASGLNIGLNGREPEGAQSSGGPVITFQPDAGLEATIEDLKGKGVEFPAGISEHDWGRVVTFTDSEGNDLQLYEPPSS
ncbi:MAG: VOC family protein [Actinomycetota bacterium]|nr:VOC family protein [Actinomycetota bacterium]